MRNQLGSGQKPSKLQRYHPHSKNFQKMVLVVTVVVEGQLRT
jgi:hypothetical protein